MPQTAREALGTVVTADLQKRLEGVQAVATLPTVAVELLGLLRDPDVSIQMLGKVIENNPSLAAKLLKVANSPVWGYGRAVDNLQRALVVLGLRQVSNIVMAVSLYSTFARLRPNPNFDRESFWLHSVGTAQIARRFAQRVRLKLQGEEFLAALLHDIGRMLLDQFLGEEFREITQKAKDTGRRLLEVEQEVLGATHADVGAHLLREWNLPEGIVNAVEFHHRPEDAPDSKVLAAVVHVSDILCELCGVGSDGDLREVVLDSDAAWEILSQESPAIADLDLARFAFELSQEMEGARQFIEIARS